MTESTITINNVTLTDAQSMTVRVALGDFLGTLSDPEFMADLGEIGPLYQARVREVLAVMQLNITPTTPTGAGHCQAIGDPA